MSITFHRFTPPTCTLEIKDNKSPLSRWKNREMPKKLQFQLSFDDPRLPTSNQVKIKGSQSDLEQLKTAVNRYVREFLHASLNPTATNVDFKIHHKLNNYPYLKAKGLVAHQLFLANLTHDAAADNIQLSTVQLFDLVTALEAYTSKFAVLPKPKQSQLNKTIPLWGIIAAATIAAVGITTIVFKSPNPQNAATDSKSDSKNIEESSQFNEIVPPQIPKINRKPTSKPKSNEPLSSTKRLPPPPAVDTPKPKPNIPDPADYPLYQVGERSHLNVAKNKTESTTVTPSETKDRKIARLNPTTEESSSRDKTVDWTEADTTESRSAKVDNPPSELSEDSGSISFNQNPSQSNQLQEIQAYFQDKWQPPADLKQSLEYRLYLNPNGSIKRVIALGKASQLYLSQTNIPVKGESFISPLTKSQQSVIRLLLDPEGGVKTFAE